VGAVSEHGCLVLVAGGGLMGNFLTITCPHCGEDFQMPADPDEGSAEFVIDCEICCRPMTVTISVRGDVIEVVGVSAA